MPAAILMSALAALVMQAAAPPPVPAAGAVQAAAQPGPAPAPAKDAKEILCKRVEITGSRLPQKDCRSRQAWADEAATPRTGVATVNANTMMQYDASAKNR